MIAVPSDSPSPRKEEEGKPLCIDLYAGLGGWTEGFLAEGYRCVGFDIEQHVYGEHQYPAELVIQDVRTIHGRQFRNAGIIVASSPCQKYSYMAMPWTRAKDLAKWYRDPSHPERLIELNELFEQPRRIQREAIEAAGGRFIPLIQENVKGAQPWVGRADWHYGSFYLWGDVPALMPTTAKRRMKSQISCAPRLWSERIASTSEEAHALHYRLPDDGQKNTGGSWFNIGSPGQKVTNQNPVHALFADGVKPFTPSGEPLGKNTLGRKHGSKSKARKAASAKIAKIPLPLARHIAQVYNRAASLDPEVAA